MTLKKEHLHGFEPGVLSIIGYNTRGCQLLRIAWREKPKMGILQGFCSRQIVQIVQFWPRGFDLRNLKWQAKKKNKTKNKHKVLRVRKTSEIATEGAWWKLGGPENFLMVSGGTEKIIYL